MGGRRKRKKSSSLDSGVTAGFDLLTEVPAHPVAIVGALVVSVVGLLGLVAWKAIKRAGGDKAPR